MELKKQEYPVLCKKSSAQSQITCDEEVNVPDSCPDVGRMIQKKAACRLRMYRWETMRCFCPDSWFFACCM